MTEQTLSPARSGTTIEQWVFRIAGLFVLASLVLSQVHSPYWLWFTAFVGANMFQASFTGFCPLAMILGKLGIHSGAAFCPLSASSKSAP
ncbi:DUF2892 domain-containing protein [uncultured Abyssibacter sp.]|uniref:YgaP family membrane protein n=1 Tax=uncultured Abyssibacter sp. TaxID=2320202 RepID=UPI0032B2D38F